MSTASTALTKSAPVVDERHSMLRHLEQQALVGDLASDERLDVSFMSRSFCLTGLPLRKLEQRDFGRKDDHFALSISTAPIPLPGGDNFLPGLPYGAKARLLVLWMNSQCRMPNRAAGDRWLEIGRVEEWMHELGLPRHHEGVSMTKSQLLRLSMATFTMVLKEKDQGREYFRSDRLIDSAVFADGDLLHYANGDLAKVRFPLGIELTEKAYKNFTSSAVIPIATDALRKISTSAMSIDFFLFLSYRLPEIPIGDSQLVSWRQLIAWFGNGEPRSKFRQVFESSIAKALDAYQGANVSITDEGLIMRYSDPVETRRMFVVSSTGSTPKTPLKRVRSNNRVALRPVETTGA